uniref:tyrosine-protein phosphatase n=1 Tax=Flavobacterium sp. TaxID=239 RepID=UPI00404B933C
MKRFNFVYQNKKYCLRVKPNYIKYVHLIKNKKNVFSIFKKKPTLDSFIPNGFIDIHNHVLPGIDDGAKDLVETQKLLEAMHEIGIASCISTPHTLHGVWDNTKKTIANSFELYQSAEITTAQTKIVRAASEYMIDNSLMERIKSERLLTLKDTIVLLEMSYQAKPLGLYDIIFELQLQGYEIILAHPERYYFFHEDFDAYEKLKRSKVQFQLNLLSTTGYYGKDVALIAEKLLKKNMIDFVGTDIHNLRHVSFFKQPVIIKTTEEICKAMEQNFMFR